MIRIYPIRTTRRQWNIFFYCKHECGTNCEYLILNNDSGDGGLTLERNSEFIDGKCPKSSKMEKTHIRLSSFDKNNPYSSDGPLFNSEEEVISDKAFTVSLYYPFSFIFDIFITSAEGFTLRDLVHSLKILYKFIYEEEERTATPQLFSLKRVCSSCGVKHLSDFVDKEEEKNEDECSICYERISEKESVKLKCKHVFHKDCMEQWVKKSGTCPLCRYNIFLCDKCSGRGVVYYQYSGVVIPLEQRGAIMNRNQSNGIFGIHSYDFEDLILKSMYYDNSKKKLFIDISG